MNFLESRGITDLYGSRDASREAFAKGLIEDGKIWMEMIQSRNQTSHTYIQQIADEIVSAILSHYHAEFEKLLARLVRLEAEES